jgi:hypothetical protein
MEPETMRQLLKMQLRHYEAFKYYTSGPIFGGEVLYFYATQWELHQHGGELVTAEAELRTCLQDETRLIWQKYLNPAATRFVPIDSHHYAMLQEPHVARIAMTIHHMSETMDRGSPTFHCMPWRQ